MMRGNYDINIIHHFLYFHLTITMRTCIIHNVPAQLYIYALKLRTYYSVPLIIYYVVKMNSSPSNEFTYFLFDFI